MPTKSRETARNSAISTIEGGGGHATERSESRALDKFYTAPGVARLCLSRLRRYLMADGIVPSLWLEPSAGAGAFLHQMPQPRIGIDLAPAAEDIERADFLEFGPDDAAITDADEIVVCGNPPFGKNASLALRFLNHAADFAEVIGFVVPRTFQKAAFQRRVDRRLWLVDEMPMPARAFRFDGAEYDVPTVFQIWRRRPELRPVARPSMSHPDFRFVGQAAAEFAIQRIGANAGRVKDAPETRSVQSHTFIQDTSTHGRVREVLASIDWSAIKWRTAGCPSIGKAEIVEAYAAAIACDEAAEVWAAG